MVWQLGIAAAQTGISIYSAGKQQREQLRTARAQQALTNQELLRQAEALSGTSRRSASQRRLIQGAAGLRGGSATASALEMDARRQLRREQIGILSQIDTSLQDKRTEKDPISKAVNSYFNAVYKKPFNQIGAEAQRFGKRVESEFRRVNKRIKKIFGW